MTARNAAPSAPSPACARRALALVLALCATTVGAAPVYVFDYAGLLPIERGAAGGARPEAVSIDPASGEICVTDAVSSALLVYNRLGAPVFRTNLAAGLSSPASACIDAEGGFVCTDGDGPGRRTIRRLTLTGEPAAFAPEAPRPDWNPLHLLIASDGRYVTLDPVAGLLVKHDPATGALLWSLPLVAERAFDVGFGRPCEGADRRFYVPAGELHQVMVVSAEGRIESAFGELGSARGLFTAPVAAAPGPAGTVAVLDRMRHKVLVFSPAGEFLAEFGNMGAGPGDLYHPLALATAPDAGLAYVAQGFEGRVQVYRLTCTDTTAPATNGVVSGAAAPDVLARAKGAPSM